MNKELQRIKIAEACGYSKGWDYRSGCSATPWNEWCIKSLPDYLNDLNAMHEAEKVLTKEQLYNYGNKLDRITLPKTSMEMCYIEGPEAGMYPDLFCATAAQRAEAFLKTIKKWNSNKI
jgi:hypothetical protein